MQQAWDDATSYAGESVFAAPVRQPLGHGARRWSIAGLLVSGVAIATLAKIAYQTESEGRDGAVHTFQKPWFLVLVMFLGMSLCLPASLALHVARAGCGCGKPKAARPLNARGLDAPLLDHLIEADEWYAPSVAPSLAQARMIMSAERQLLHLLLPTLFDLVGSALLNIGLVFVSASAAQMLRQSLLLFATALAVAVYRKPLNRLHFLGLAICLAGLGAVTATSLVSGFGGRWEEPPSPSSPPGAPAAAGAPDPPAPGLGRAWGALLAALLPGAAGGRGGEPAPGIKPSWSGFWVVEDRREMGLGIGLIVASQALQALQLWADREQQWREERGRALSPLGVVGCEGVIGALITAFVVLPILGHGPGREGFGLREDTIDSLLCIWRSTSLKAVLLAQLAAMQLYNGCMMVLSGELDMTQATLLQAARTLFVWAANLLLHALGPPHLGEPLEPWSLLQLAAFGAAAAGAALYSRGDSERVRQSRQLEAALILLDQPPSASSAANSVCSYYPAWRTPSFAALFTPAAAAPPPRASAAGAGASPAGASPAGASPLAPGSAAGGWGASPGRYGGSSGGGGGGGGVSTTALAAAARGDFLAGSIGRSMLQGAPPPARPRPPSLSATPPTSTPRRQRSLRAAALGDPFGPSPAERDGGSSSASPSPAAAPPRPRGAAPWPAPARGNSGSSGGSGVPLPPVARRASRLQAESEDGWSPSSYGSAMSHWPRPSPPSGSFVAPPPQQQQQQQQQHSPPPP